MGIVSTSCKLYQLGDCHGSLDGRVPNNGKTMLIVDGRGTGYYGKTM